jgi:hypothetical protein
VDRQRDVSRQLDDELLRATADREDRPPGDAVGERERILRRRVRTQFVRAPTIVAPTRRGRRSRATVSTSGSSGMFEA